MRNKLLFGLTWSCVTLLLIAGCKIDDDGFDLQERYFEELKIIDAYLDGNNIKADVDPASGIRYVIHEQGTGIAPYVVDSVTVDFKGSLLSEGTVYEEESDTKRLWDDLLPAMRVVLNKIQEGGAVTAYVPSYYAYGPAGTDEIPANTIVVFDFDLKAVHAQQLLKDIAAIEDSLEVWEIETELHRSGIRYILEQGDGRKPTENNGVTVNYQGRLLGANSVFDSGRNVTFLLGNLISGWRIMLPEVREEGTIIMYIPSIYGYGSKGSGSNIPPNANLEFTVDLLEVK